MPAQWPTFIKNVSDRMASQSSISRDEFALYVSNEYFNAVKGNAQSPYGDKHVPGIKPVLDAGFVEAFEQIYTEERILFDDKPDIAKFADFNEPSVVPNFKTDPNCEIEHCIKQQAGETVTYIDYRENEPYPTRNHTYDKFNYFSFFPSMCPVPFEEEVDFTGGINIEEFILDKVAAENALIEEAENEPRLFATMSIFGFTEDVKYNFLYTLNGEEQPITSADENGILIVSVPVTPGKYNYVFKSVFDDEENLIKNIDKRASVEILEKGEPIVINVLEDESDKNEPTPKIDPIMLVDFDTSNPRDEGLLDFIVENLVGRILLQNDESENFHWWVKRFGGQVHEAGGYGRLVNRISGRVKDRILELQQIVNDKMYEEAVKNDDWAFQLRYIRSNANSNNNLNKKITNRFDVKEIREEFAEKLNQYVWQPDTLFDIDMPKWMDYKFITAFTYDERHDGVNWTGNRIPRSGNDSTGFGGLRNERITRDKKKNEHKKERDKWFNRLTACVSNKADSDDNEPDSLGNDGYMRMAKGIIDYWKSCGVQPLSKTPPIPPCAIPAPLTGIYVPIYYGSQTRLANHLRRAWNTGKRFKTPGVHRPPSTAVATAVASACSLHLLELKFIYLGGIPTIAGPVPMIGFMPVVF
jgi:hypothetical protein